MIAAVYSRKSTEQNVSEDAKSITRHLEHARAFAERPAAPAAWLVPAGAGDLVVTTAKASRFVLERLASGSTVLLAILLDQGAAPTFASSQPAMGDPRGSASIGADPVS